MSLTIRNRIILTLVPLLVLVVVLGGAGVALLSHLGDRIDVILRENYDSIVAMERLNEALERIDSSFQFTLAGQEARARDQYRENWPVYRKQLRFEQGNITLPGEQELVDELTELTSRYQQQGDAFYARANTPLLRQLAYFGPSGLLELFTRLKAVSGQIRQINQDYMEESSRQARRTAAVSRTGLAIGLMAAVLLAGVGTWYTLHSILGPIKAVTESARGVSAGKLDQVVPYLSGGALGELAEAFNQMTRRLRQDRQSAEERTTELAHTAEGLRKEISEREQLEQSLRHLAAIVESSDDAIIGKDLDGVITSWNRGAERVFGYRAEEALGRPHSILVPPEHVSELLALEEQIKQGKHVEHFETVRRRKDGQRIVVALTFFPVRDESGALIGMASISRDITERKQAQEALRRAADYNRRLLEASLDPLVTIGPDGKITDVNSATETATGFSRAELLGHDFADYFTQPEHARAGYQRVFSEGAVHDYPLEMRHQDGRVMSVLYNAAVFRSEAGNVVGVFAAARDVTERKRAEELLRRSNRALVAISGCNQAMIRATDEAGLLQQICQIVVEKAGYRLCWVGYAEQDEAKTVRPVAQAGFEEGYLKAVNVTWADTERGRGPTGTCIRTGRLSLIRNMATDPRFAPWREEARKRGYASSLAIPLLADSGVLGALTIYASEPDAFNDEEVKLLTELAGDLAFGIVGLRTRAERKTAVELQAAREREVKIGFEIQQTLLLDPLPVDVPGLRVAALTAPSRQIDGDFYHFYKHENGVLDVIVADVMGKGIPAAILGAATKSHFLRALSHLLGVTRNGRLPEPRDIVTLADAEMVRHLINLESFVTLCYLRIDRNQCGLALVDCGHTGLIHRRARTGACETVHGGNLALGMRQGEIYDQLTRSFDPGDLLLLYSDGITEARNRAGELFGEERLVQCIQDSNRLDPEDLVQAISRAVFAFSGSESLRDDLTCVAIQVVEREIPLTRQELDIRSDLKELSRARAFVRSACRNGSGAALDADSIGDLELAVTEACSNIVRHAYRGRADQWIHLAAEGFPGKVSVRIHHLGEPFDPSKVSPPRFDGSRESGFGVYLIRHSVDEVRYYRDERGRNCVALMKNRRAEKGDGSNGPRG